MYLIMQTLLQQLWWVCVGLLSVLEIPVPLSGRPAPPRLLCSALLCQPPLLSTTQAA